MLLDKRRIILVLYMLLAGVLVIASYYYSNRLEYSLLENNFIFLKEQAEQQNRIIRSKIDSQMTAVSLLSDTLANIPDFPNKLTTIAPKYGFNTEYEQLFYINAQGFGNAPLVGKIDISQEPYFRELLAGKTVLTPIRRSSKALSFFIISPVVQDDLHLGFIANEIDSTYIYSLMAQLVDGDTYMYVLDELGNTIALVNNGYALQVGDSLSASLQNMIFTQFDLDFLEDAYQFESARENEEATFFYIDFQGRKRLAYMTPVGIQSWSLVAFLPLEKISNAAFTIQRNFYVFTLVSIVIVGLFLCYVVVVNLRNQNLKENLIRELTTRAQIDKLTKVYTKEETEARIGTYLKYTHDTDVSALLVIDIDNFEHINAVYGDEYGDIILKEIAYNIKHSFRSTDIVGRTDGTQFVVLVHKIQTKELIEMKAVQVMNVLQKMKIAQDPDKLVSASIGISMCPVNGRNYHDLYKNADAAMFYAKQNGKNAYVFFDKAQKLEVKKVKSIQYSVAVKDHVMEMEKLEAQLVSLLYGTQDMILATNEFIRRVADSFKLDNALIVDYNAISKDLTLTSEFTNEELSPIFTRILESHEANEINIESIVNSKSTILEILSTDEDNDNDIAFFLGKIGIKSAVFIPFIYKNEKRGFMLLATQNIRYRWQRHLYPSLAFIARLYSVFRRGNLQLLNY